VISDQYCGRRSVDLAVTCDQQRSVVGPAIHIVLRSSNRWPHYALHSPRPSIVSDNLVNTNIVKIG